MGVSHMGVSHNSDNKKKKVIFILGATATGKTKLSLDIASRFNGEIINSDKIQVYKGLDIITNKIPKSQRRGIPHHLMEFVHPEADFTVHDFCYYAVKAIEHVIANGHVPIIVGGSNSYIEALVEDPRTLFRKNYDFCFFWMHVSLPVLHDYVGKRIDHMMEEGLVDEVRGMFVPGADYSRGIRRAIGAPELDRYFTYEKSMEDDQASKDKLLGECIEDMKINTCKLVNSQLKKIRRMRNDLGWKMLRIDATSVFEKYGNKFETEEAWNKVVWKPAMQMVNAFLYGE